MRFEIEPLKIMNGSYVLRGWAVPDGSEPLEVVCHNAKRQKLDIIREDRKDVAALYPDRIVKGCGFYVEIPQEDFGGMLPIIFRMRSGSEKARYNFTRMDFAKRSLLAASGPIGKGARLLSDIRHDGPVAAYQKRFTSDGSYAARFGDQNPKTYRKFLKKYDVTGAELDAQRSKYEDWLVSDTQLPIFHFVTAVYKPEEKYLKELIGSLQAQTAGNWDAYLAECSVEQNGKISPEGMRLRRILEDASLKDSRIHPVFLDTNDGISKNTNAAVMKVCDDLYTGSMDELKSHFIAFCDHDDLLTPDAVYENTLMALQYPDAGLIYSDEDKIDNNGRRFAPHFKPDFNLDLLLSNNYICHLVTARLDVALTSSVYMTGIYERCISEHDNDISYDELLEGFPEWNEEIPGILDLAFDGAQDFDFVLRMSHVLGFNENLIKHIPKVLYHWRSHPLSTAEDPESKRYAFDAGRHAIERHHSRQGINALVTDTEFVGRYRTRYIWKDAPLISIMIPNKDHTDDLAVCLASIARQNYANYEIIIIENNSEDPKTFDYYDALDDSIRVIRYEKKGFNFSAINNLGARHAKGEYLLLLNNDTEMIDPGCLTELVSFAKRSDVGIVGAKLLYNDDTIQHAGVIMGTKELADHAFTGCNADWPGYAARIATTADLSCVTAACLIVKKSIYMEVGGMDERLAVAFNDVDFCLKVREAGYRIVYNPAAVLYHYESKSRGSEDTMARIMRFEGEVALMKERWHDILESGDPAYNPNLEHERADFCLKR